MKWFSWFRKDRDGLERAKRAEVIAQQSLTRAHEHLETAEKHVEEVRAEWPKTVENARQSAQLLRRDSLSQRFLTELHGGQPT